MSLAQEIARRKTFGIIAHPDAGKTTLTEKLLLFGGAIQTAGAVKSNKIDVGTRSDWMDIEKQRGISVATSVMGFEYKDLKINILDTPGHADFAEDTYRTLTAVDSVIMVIDCVKGVEGQTEKLMEVCRMRNTPVICFINKLDREGRDAFDLLDEIEQKLEIKVRPMSWPIGMGKSLRGVYNIFENNLNLYEPSKSKRATDVVNIKGLDDPIIADHLPESALKTLREEIELVNGVYGDLDTEAYLNGAVAPVFFGSAVNNFGVREMLDCFTQIAPTPRARMTEERSIEPSENKFSGFIFKIHANMDPKHRNRIAFARICSGVFKRGNNYYHVRDDKKIRFSNVTAFMAQQKETIDEAYPGDIVGLYDTGNLKIGDTLNEGEKGLYKGIPSFSPELFKEVINLDAMKSKQLEKGLSQLMDEGVAQLFSYEMGARKVVGTVGALQFEVLQHRLLNEYGAKVQFAPVNIFKACWIGGSEKEVDAFVKDKYRHIAKDKEGKLVFMAETKAWLQMVEENFPKIAFHSISEF
ncbi:MAG: peptide chain release factor 3 [Cyclobacteriaceae bacterium]